MASKWPLMAKEHGVHLPQNRCALHFIFPIKQRLSQIPVVEYEVTQHVNILGTFSSTNINAASKAS